MADAGRRPSLRRRLTLLLLGGLTLAWLGVAAYSYIDTERELDELLDAHLAQSAALLVAQAGHELDEIDTEDVPSMHRYGRQVAFQIWDRKHGELLLRSAGAPAEPLGATTEGFEDAVIEGLKWRVFTTRDREGKLLIQVAERHDARDRIAGTVAGNLLVPLLVALPLLGALVWFGVARGLRPLGDLARQVEGRDPRSLDPIPSARAPAEVEPLVQSLNGLFGRVRASMDHERRFTADAAHELRTPLAALRVQAQVARGAADDAGRQAALDHVIEGCDRATHLVGQLLTLARLDPGGTAGTLARCELRAVAAQAVALQAPAAVARDIEIELADGDPAAIEGDPGLLAILLRNLLDNAVRYSPPRTTVTVAVNRDGGAVLLSVSDGGPGIPPAERARVGQRFHRVLGTGEEGSGLGLSIAGRIAEIHGAGFELDDGPGGRGLTVRVRFGAAGHGC